MYIWYSMREDWSPCQEVWFEPILLENHSGALFGEVYRVPGSVNSSFLETYENITRGPWALVLCLRTNELGHWPSSEVAHTLSFYPRGEKLSLFSIHGQRFPRYGPTIKIAIFGHEKNLAIDQSFRSCTDNLFLPLGGLKSSLFSLYGQKFPRYGQIFKIAIFGHKTWQVAKGFQKLHIYSLSTQLGRNWAYFRFMGNDFGGTGQFSKLPYLGMKLGKYQLKFQKLHVYSLSTSRGRNWAYICSKGSGFRDTGLFSKLPYMGMKLGH